MALYETITVPAVGGSYRSELHIRRVPEMGRVALHVLSHADSPFGAKQSAIYLTSECVDQLIVALQKAKGG